MEQITPPVGGPPHPPAGASGPRPGAQPGSYAGAPAGPPPGPPPGQQPGQHPGQRGSDGFYDSLRRSGLVRTQERWIGGVAGGVAHRFGIDPLLVRGILGVTVLLGGVGLVLYGLAWALLPEESDGRIHLQETFLGRFDAAILGALAFVIIGANRGAGWSGWWADTGFGWVDGVLWLGVVIAVVAVLVSAAGRRGHRVAPRDPAAPWPAVPPRGGRAPHPGYGTVPLASPAPTAPPGPSWAGSTSGTPSPVPPPPGVPGGYGGYGGSGMPPTGPSGASAYRPSPPPVPPVPPRPPKPRVLGPGVAVVGTVVGLTLLALAALLVVEREGALGQPVALTALGVGIVLAGAGIMVSGLRGRRSGVLGFLAVVAVLVSVPVAFEPRADGRFGFATGGERLGISSGEVWRPTSVAEAERGLSVGVGDVDVDLTALPLGSRPIDIPIGLGAGDLEVVVPEDVALTGEISLQAGQVAWDVDGRTVMAGLTGGRGTELFESDEVADGDVDMAIRITAGAGDIRVVEEES